jgi:mono/diheme cytochrome c family protein
MKTLITFILGLIALPVLAALAGVLGLLPTVATSEPPKWEEAMAGRALDASVEKRSKGLQNPIAANDSAALAAGKKIYGDNCAGCHGDPKSPSEWGSKGLYPRVPQFFQEGGSDLKPAEAYAIIHDGIRYSGMGAWRGVLDDQAIWQVANYLAQTSKSGEKGRDSR